MNYELFSSIVGKVNQELPEIRTITVSGFGEFASDPGWRKKIDLAAKRFDKVHVLTTLSLLNDDDIYFILDRVADLRISLYGVTCETYQRIHRPPREINLDIIERRVRLINSEKRPNQRLVLNYLELPDNRHETEMWISRWTGKADLLEVWRPHNWIDGREYRNPCVHRLPSCGRPDHGPIQVQVDGTVNVCCFDYNGELEIGDLKKDNFSDIFNGVVMKSIQAAHREGRADKIPQCRICDQRNCDECKVSQLLYNSQFNKSERIHMTSTDYERLEKEDAHGDALT